MTKGKVIVGMSGGVDSSVAAGMLAYQLMRGLAQSERYEAAS